MSNDVQIRGGQGSAPQTYVVPNATEIIPRAINATFDGTAAVSSYKPTIEIVSDGGVVVARVPTDTTVAAGGSAEVSWFPGVRPQTTPGGVTYAQRIILLKSSYTCVAEWQLDEGASPYLDTSGFSIPDPSTMTRQIRVVPMTQNFASGPTAEAPAGPSVAFNFDGTNATSSGDFLTDAVATPGRYDFLGNLPFTVVCWVQPGAGVNTHDGPVISTVHVTGFGTPGAHDDGWWLNVTQPGRIPRFSRFAAVLSGFSPDTCSGSAISTSQWSMLVGTYDGATMRFYVNGVQVTSTASAGAITGAANNAFIGLGVKDQGNTSTWYFGAASQGSIWSAVFTAQDVADLYASASN